MRLAQELVAASDPIACLIDADGYGILKDNLHYTAQGYIDMGKNFSQAYLNSRSGDATATGDWEGMRRERPRRSAVGITDGGIGTEVIR